MIEKFRSRRNKQFYFRVVAGNGKTVAQSEGYKTKRSRDKTVFLLGNLVLFGGERFSTRKGELGQ